MQSACPFGFPKHANNYLYIPNPLRGQPHRAPHRIHSHRGLGKWRQRCGGRCRSSEIYGQKNAPVLKDEGDLNVLILVKKKGELPRLKCFHNGIILIVNCFISSDAILLNILLLNNEENHKSVKFIFTTLRL